MRLLTIHAAKGLEFKVVIVADAGRDTGGRAVGGRDPRAARRPLRLPRDRPDVGQAQGRLRLRGGARGREARGRRRAAAPLLRRDDARDRPADRLRRDRPRARAGPRDADRLGARAARRRGRDRARADEPVELERGDARFVLTRRPLGDAAGRAGRAGRPEARASSRSSTSCRRRPAPRGYRLPELVPPPPPPLHRVRRLSYSALALFERCSYRYYAERVAGLREERGTVPGAARAEGDRDRRRRPPPARARRPGRARAARRRDRARLVPGGDRRGARAHRGVRRRVLRVRARGADRDARRARGPSGRSRSSTTACCCTAASTCSGARARARSSLDYKTNSLAEGTPEEIVEADYRLQRLVYALACFRAGADEVEVVYHFLERPDAVVSTTFERLELPAARGRAVGGDRAHQRRRVRRRRRASSLRRLPGARPRLRRAAARRRSVAAASAPSPSPRLSAA